MPLTMKEIFHLLKQHDNFTMEEFWQAEVHIECVDFLGEMPVVGAMDDQDTKNKSKIILEFSDTHHPTHGFFSKERIRKAFEEEDKSIKENTDDF